MRYKATRSASIHHFPLRLATQNVALCRSVFYFAVRVTLSYDVFCCVMRRCIPLLFIALAALHSSAFRFQPMCSVSLRRFPQCCVQLHNNPLTCAMFRIAALRSDSPSCTPVRSAALHFVHHRCVAMLSAVLCCVPMCCLPPRCVALAFSCA